MPFTCRIRTCRLRRANGRDVTNAVTSQRRWRAKGGDALNGMTRHMRRRAKAIGAAQAVRHQQQGRATGSDAPHAVTRQRFVRVCCRLRLFVVFFNCLFVAFVLRFEAGGCRPEMKRATLLKKAYNIKPCTLKPSNGALLKRGRVISFSHSCAQRFRARCYVILRRCGAMWCARSRP